MSPALREWLLHSGAVAAAGWLLPSFGASGLLPVAVGGLLLYLGKRYVRPVLFVLTLPVTVLTLGFFYLMLNGFTLWLAAAVTPGLAVAGFWAGVWAALVVSILVAVGRRLLWRHL